MSMKPLKNTELPTFVLKSHILSSISDSKDTIGSFRRTDAERYVWNRTLFSEKDSRTEVAFSGSYYVFFNSFRRTYYNGKVDVFLRLK